MTYPPSGGTPDPYQPPQSYSRDPALPYSPGPSPEPGGGPPAGHSEPSNHAAEASRPGGYVPPYSAAGQPYQPDGCEPNPYGTAAYPAYLPQVRTNALAIASLICSLGGLITCVGAPVGIVLGHVAKRQIRQSGEQGGSLARAGLWVGYVLTIVGVLLTAGWLTFVVFLVHTSTATTVR